MAGFSTLNTAISGLMAAQRALDVTGQNVVNANTPGYSRQAIRLGSQGATTAATFHTGGTSPVVGGVVVEGVERIRDTFLEATRAAAGASQQALDAQLSALKGAEQLMSEPGDGGLQTVLDDFFSEWHGLAQRPTADAASVVLQSGRAVAARLAFISEGIDDRWATTRESLKSTVSQLNQAAADLAKINVKIREGTIAGRPVNELLDQRDQLVRTLAEMAGATAVPAPDNMVSITISGMTVVAEGQAETFSIGGAADLAAATADPPNVTFGTANVSVSSGKAAGLLAALRTDLPTVSARLDGVAISLRDAVNTVHATGFAPDGSSGLDFFSGGGAANLSVVPTAISELALSAVPGTNDGSVAGQIADLASDSYARSVLGSDGPSELWRSMVADLGTQVLGVQRAATVQATVVATAQDAVDADAGVNLDEEMSSLLLYQRSYQASARVITAVDEMLDTLVNRLGTVGR